MYIIIIRGHVVIKEDKSIIKCVYLFEQYIY